MCICHHHRGRGRRRRRNLGHEVLNVQITRGDFYLHVTVLTQWIRMYTQIWSFHTYAHKLYSLPFLLGTVGTVYIWACYSTDNESRVSSFFNNKYHGVLWVLQYRQICRPLDTIYIVPPTADMSQAYYVSKAHEHMVHVLFYIYYTDA